MRPTLLTFGWLAFCWLSVAGPVVREAKGGGRFDSRESFTHSPLLTAAMRTAADMSSDSTATSPIAIVPIDSLGKAFKIADSAATDASRDSTGNQSVGSTPAPRKIDKPPGEAWTTIRSGLIPGWGQLVNRKPLKAGLFFGAWAFLGAQAIVAESDRREAQEAFDESGSEADMIAVNDAVDQRNSRLWWMGGVAVFAMLDAYVDVHFWGFEEQWQARV
ncbi:MAG TPA: hypothetical protein VF720_00565, partial [Candidatus Eisenbacteria bacterium]